jgi:carbamoyl-phosphate synthase small subunit
VAYDLGIKRNILRKLTQSGCKVHVVPASTSAETVLALKPDGIFLSNGPGDPTGVPYVAENINKLAGEAPIFGICLGHQIISLALGAKTYKLRFGHHGGNHPVMDLRTNKVEITSQNHVFAVEQKSLKSTTEVISINLNDKTVEGIRHKKQPIMSVQYHPEASPGPHDSSYLFQNFIDMMKGH